MSLLTRLSLFIGIVIVLTTGIIVGPGWTTRVTALEQAEGKKLRHLVLFQFKDECTKAQIKEVEQSFADLPNQIDEIIEFEWGTDVSVENRHQGFTHCFLVTFRNEAGREAYFPHAAHAKFGDLVGPLLKDVLVVDYWPR